MKRLTQTAAVLWILSSVLWEAHERFTHWPSVAGVQVLGFIFAVVVAAVIGVIVYESIRLSSRRAWWLILGGLFVPLVVPTVISVALLDRRWWAWWLVLVGSLIGSLSVIEPSFWGVFFIVQIGLLLTDAVASWRLQRQWLSFRTFILDPLCRDSQLYGIRTATGLTADSHITDN